MENRAHALAAGLFALLLGAALAAVALWFSKDDLKLIPYAMTTLSDRRSNTVENPSRRERTGRACGFPPRSLPWALAP